MQETIRSAKRLAQSKTLLIKKSHTATPTVKQDDWLHSQKIREINYTFIKASFNAS